MKPHLRLTSLGVMTALGLAACVNPDERPLPPDHPASPLAPEAPRQRSNGAPGPDAESERTRQLLTEAARQNQAPEPGPANDG